MKQVEWLVGFDILIKILNWNQPKKRKKDIGIEDKHKKMNPV
jgi:hypothetical protein